MKTRSALAAAELKAVRALDTKEAGVASIMKLRLVNETAFESLREMKTKEGENRSTSREGGKKRRFFFAIYSFYGMEFNLERLIKI